MIPNCKGCEEELNQAYWHQQNQGYHVATCKDYPSSENIGQKGHYFMIMVNEEGYVMII